MKRFQYTLDIKANFIENTYLSFPSIGNKETKFTLLSSPLNIQKLISVINLPVITGDRQNCIMRSFIICTLLQI
jgi:hypothetical protein